MSASQVTKSADLDELVIAIRASKKYAHISEATLRHLGQIELSKRRTLKDAIKETRNKLHQIGGAYQDAMHYAAWLGELEAAEPGARTTILSRIMHHHASTRERLPILDPFYTTIFEALRENPGEVHSILDVACGLNPLAIPWMPLLPDTTYHALDIYADMIQFVGRCLALMQVKGTADTCDVVAALADPTSEAAQVLRRPVDVAFVLKTIPCLEQVDKRIGSSLLDILGAKQLVVSFPIQSLGGKRKGMLQHYSAHFAELMAGRPWPVQRLEFESELVFIVRKM
nr:ribosomal RNA methyltransferase (FmrO) [uncultured bacterium]